jgi:MFS family permease
VSRVGAAGPVPVGPRTARADLALLVTGVAVSTAGDAAALIALSVQLREGGAGWVAALLGAELLPIVVLAPWTGRLVDRLENRRLAVIALAGQAVVAVPLALAGPRWLVVALFALLSAFSAVVRPVTSAMVPAITGPDGAARGYARIALGSGLGFILGPAAGGVLTGAYGPRTALLADAATFVVLAIAWTQVRTRRDPRRAAEPTDGDVLEAGDPASVRPSPLPSPLRDRVLLVGLVLSAVAIGCGVVDNVAAPFRFIDQLAAGASGFGTYLAIWGAGGLVGSQLAPRLVRPGAAVRLLAVGNVLCGLAIAGIGVAPVLAVAYVASLIGGAGNGFANVALNALVVERVPAAQHGRAFALVGAVVQTAVGIGTAAGAPLVVLLGADGAMTAAGVVCAVLAGGHVFVTLRTPARPETVGPGW